MNQVAAGAPDPIEAERRATAAGLAKECKPLAGSLAAAYLAARGIALDNLPRGCLGWHSPSNSMLTVGRDGNGEIACVQRLFFDGAGKVFNLVRGLQKEIDDNADTAPVLQPLKDRAERILKDLENRNTTGLAAMDLLAALAVEKDAAAKAAKETGLTPKAFAAFWALRDNIVLKEGGIAPLDLAKEIEKLLGRFPNAKVNPDEQRQFRASLYRPLISLPKEARSDVVDLIMANVLGE